MPLSYTELYCTALNCTFLHSALLSRTNQVSRAGQEKQTKQAENDTTEHDMAGQDRVIREGMEGKGKSRAGKGKNKTG